MTLRGGLGGLMLAGAGLLLAACGGDSDETPAEQPAQEIDGADDPAETPSAETPSDAARNGSFEDWVASAAGAGMTIEAGAVSDGGVATNLTLTASGWSLTASEAQLNGLDGGTVTVVPQEGATMTFAANAAGPDMGVVNVFDIAMSGGASRAAVSGVDIEIALSEVTVSGWGDAPLVIGSGDIVFSAGAGDGGDLIDISIEDVALPEGDDQPFGSVIESLEITMSLGSPIAVSDIDLEWRALEIEGAGELSFDEAGVLVGRFDVEMPNILDALDAYNVVVGMDRDVMADTYAALLREIAEAEPAAWLPYLLLVEDGEARLSGESRGIADIQLGPILPVLSSPAE